MKRRTWTRVLLVALGLILAAGAFFAWRIGPRNLIGLLRYDQRREGRFRVGDPAPDVVLARLDGSGETRLLEHAGGKPLVLIFGSFT